MIDAELAAKATLEDEVLLRAVHPAGARILHLIAGKWKMKRIPIIGVVVSDAEMIREIFMDRVNFTKMGEGASGGLWTPIIGEYGLVNMDGDSHIQLKRHLAPAFSNKICPEIVNKTIAEHGGELKKRLLSGEDVDVVHEIAHFAYRTLWEFIGLPQDRLSEVNFDTAVKTLRSVTEGVTVTKKVLSPKNIEMAKAKLLFVEELARETYRKADDSTSIPGLMKAEGFGEEEAISIVKSLMITGTETIISFLPRMAALFLKSGYLDYLTEHPEHLPKGIEEALRVIVPTPVAARIAKNNVIFHGIPVKKGERMVLSTVEACHRYGPFNPFQDVDKNVKGLWFGAGVHMCIGLPLAMAEATAFAEILIEVHKISPLEIIEQTSNDKGHTGSFKKFVVRCKTSSND